MDTPIQARTRVRCLTAACQITPMMVKSVIDATPPSSVRKIMTPDMPRCTWLFDACQCS